MKKEIRINSIQELKAAWKVIKTQRREADKARKLRRKAMLAANEVSAKEARIKRHSAEARKVRKAKLHTAILAGAACTAPDRRAAFHRNVYTSMAMSCGEKGRALKHNLKCAIAAHDAAWQALFADQENEDLKKAEAEAYRAVRKICATIVVTADECRTEKSGYELLDKRWDAYTVKSNGKTVVTTLYGNCEANRMNDTGKIVVAFVEFASKCPERVVPACENEEFIVRGASNGGLKGHVTGDDKKEGVAIAFRKSFLEGWDILNCHQPFVFVLSDEAIKAGFDTVEAAQAKMAETADSLEKAMAVKKAASDAIEKHLIAHPKTRSIPKELKDAGNAADAALAAAKAEYKSVIDYVGFAANPDVPKQVAAKNAQHTGFATTPCDEIEFYLDDNDVVVKQDDCIDDVDGVVLKKPDGTEEKCGYHFTGDDGGCTAPMDRVNKGRAKADWLYTLQFRTSDLSAKGLMDVAEHITLEEAKVRFGEDASVGVVVSEDRTHNVYVFPEKEVSVVQADGTTKTFHVGTDAVMSESTWKSKALDNSSINAWLSRHGRFAAMRCEATNGFVRLGRQAIEILSQMTFEENTSICDVTFGSMAKVAHPLFAMEEVQKQIPAFKHPVLQYLSAAPGSQRQLNKTQWNKWVHSCEGRVEVEGAELPTFGDPNYRLDRMLGKSREEAGKIKPGFIFVPKSSGLKIGAKVWIIRYPLTNPRPVVLTVQGYCAEGRCEFSMMVGSTVMQDLAMDFDGDHCYVVWNRDCVRAAIRTQEWIDGFMPFKHFTAEDIPARDVVKYLPANKYSESALGLGNIGTTTSPIFVLQSVLYEGMDPDERIVMPNGEVTSAREIISLIYWICVAVTWEADAVKRGASSGFEKTAIGRRIAKLVKKTYAPSQPYARPYETDKFGLLFGKDKLAGKYCVHNDMCVTEVIAEYMTCMLKSLTLPEEDIDRVDFASYNAVMYGAYDENGELTGGWVARLSDIWGSIWDSAEVNGVNLNERWAIPTFTAGTQYDGKMYVEKPISGKTYHIAPGTDVDGEEFLELLNANCGDRKLNWEPGWVTTIVDGVRKPFKEKELSLSLFIARKERAVAAASVKQDNDGGRRKTAAKEDAYEAARKLIRAWAWERFERDLTDKEVDEKLYIELGYALIGSAVESTNMGASLQEWARYFNDDAEVVDSVTGKKYKRNFLTARADAWQKAHEHCFCDNGFRNKEGADREVHVTDVQFLKWLNAWTPSDVTFYRDLDIDHCLKQDDGEELVDVASIMADCE